MPAVSKTIQQSLAFKAYEIEELADVFFFRPLGAVIAYAARSLRLTPTQLTLGGAAIGIIGGALLYDARLGLIAFGLLIVHGIFDSADGQLARLTGQVSEIGRVLDGVGGYATYAAIYVAIAAHATARGGSASVAFWAVLAAIANILQAQMYDYHRSSYATIVVSGQAPRSEGPIGGWAARVMRVYTAVRRPLIGAHGQVEEAVAARAHDGTVREEDRERYRACFYGTVRGWNLLGDNTRFYAIGVLAWLRQIDWFFAFILLPMDAALVLLWLWQRRVDRRFLAAL
jgi:phosphatidylglycerophosphate synthase